MMLKLILLSLQVGIYMGLYVSYSSNDFLVPDPCHLLLSDGPLYAFSLFTPTIIRQASFIFAIYSCMSHCHGSLVICTVISITFWWLPAGYKSTEANLLSVPVYAWGSIVTCVIGILGDRIGHRCYINLYAASLNPLQQFLISGSRGLFSTGKPQYFHVSASGVGTEELI